VVEAAVGLKVMEIVQLAPAATEPAQLSLSVKTPALMPLGAMLGIVRVPLPPLLSVSVCAAEVLPVLVPLNVRPVPESVACGTVAVAPVPVRMRVRLGDEVLSVAVMVSVTKPTACGMKLKTSVQLAPGASETVVEAQVLAEVWRNAVVAPVWV
jgi:hypothetical protein